MHEQMAIAVAASICGVSIHEKFLIQGFSKEMARNIISGSDNYKNNKEFFSKEAIIDRCFSMQSCKLSVQ